MFPYSGIQFATFDYLKRFVISKYENPNDPLSLKLNSLFKNASEKPRIADSNSTTRQLSSSSSSDYVDEINNGNGNGDDDGGSNNSESSFSSKKPPSSSLSSTAAAAAAAAAAATTTAKTSQQQKQHHQHPHQLPLPITMVCGGMAAAISSILTYPLDLTR